VDNYGPQVEIGGGAFSGKDWSKVDRSAAYIARYIAKYYLQKHNFQWVKTKIAYCIGVAQPVMISIETNEGERTYDLDLDLTPAGIRDLFNLTALDYYQTAKRGHFGN
jgi:S-adenosylmethionine synthetase